MWSISKLKFDGRRIEQYGYFVAGNSPPLPFHVEILIHRDELARARQNVTRKHHDRCNYAAN